MKIESHLLLYKEQGLTTLKRAMSYVKMKETQAPDLRVETLMIKY